MADAPPRRLIKSTRTERVDVLAPQDRQVMWELMSSYYDNTTRAQFESDLDGKQYLIRMFDGEGGLCGFSTIQLIPFEFQGRRTLTVFSGDTVIDRACWGQKALQKAFSRFLLKLLFTRRGQLYWFLISKGYKTYLFMRNNLVSYPNYASETPPAFQALLDHVATLKYPDHYDARKGVIAFPEEACVVKGAYARVTEEDQKNPDVRFFVERNPGYVRGDELCCLARVTYGQVAWSVVRYTFNRFFGRRRARSAPVAASEAPV